MDDVISDNSRFAALLQVSGVFAIMNLVGAGLLIASLTSSSIDKGPIIKGVIPIVGTVIAACAEIVLVWVGTPEDRKEAFKDEQLTIHNQTSGVFLVVIKDYCLVEFSNL